MPSKSEKQARFMAACAHGADYDECPPKTVAKEFNQADKKTGMLSRESLEESRMGELDEEVHQAVKSLVTPIIKKYKQFGGSESTHEELKQVVIKLKKRFSILSNEEATSRVNKYFDSKVLTKDQKDYDDVKEGLSIPKGVKSFFKNVDRASKGKDLDSRIKQEIDKGFDATMAGDHKTAKKQFRRFDRLDNLKDKPKNPKESDKKITESEDVYKLVDANKWHLMQGDKLLVANLDNERQAKTFHGGHGYGKETKVVHGAQVRRNAYLKKSSTGFINWPDYKGDVKESEDAGMVVENKWYEMMLSSSNVKRFQAKDNEEAKVLARKSKAKSLIRCTRDGMPVGKIGNNLLKESVSFKQYLVEEKEIDMWTADSGDYDVQHPERFHSIGNYASKEEAQAALDKCKNKGIMGPIHKRKGPMSWLKKGPQ